MQGSIAKVASHHMHLTVSGVDVHVGFEHEPEDYRGPEAFAVECIELANGQWLDAEWVDPILTGALQQALEEAVAAMREAA